MPRNRWFFVSTLLMACASSHAQSLGDVARAQQQTKQQNGSSTTKKIYTNEDLKSASSSDEPAKPQNQLSANKNDAEEDDQPNQPMTADQWKAAIQAQKDRIATLEQKIDKAQARIHYVQSDLYYNGVQHNEMEKRYQEQIDRAKSALDQEKQKLAEMQEAARRAGMANSVYQ